MAKLAPLAPKSVAAYARVIDRAFGGTDQLKPEVQKWPESVKDILRAAIRRRYLEAGMDPEPMLKRIPVGYRVKKTARIPGEEDAIAYENKAKKLPPGKRALAVLPLALGFRAEELCNIEREEIKRAIRTGSLTFTRKGGKEHTLRTGKVTELLKELLAVPRAPGPFRIARRMEPQDWDRVGEILSPASYNAQYHKLRDLVSQTAREAGIGHLSPHKLRHAFATRMNRDGAPLFTIQAALNHSNISTTQKYVHPSEADVDKFTRGF